MGFNSGLKGLNMAMSPYFSKRKEEISEKKNTYLLRWNILLGSGQFYDTHMLFNICYTMDEKLLPDVKVI